jgi:hypothetical protein
MAAIVANREAGFADGTPFWLTPVRSAELQEFAVQHFVQFFV